MTPRTCAALLAFVGLAVSASLCTACGYGKASPESCHAKFIRDRRGHPGDYERCMDAYRRAEAARQYARDKQRLKQLRVQRQIDALGDGGAGNTAVE